MSTVWMTILGFAIIFLATTSGAALVFFFKKDISDRTNALFLGFAAGIMIAASVWSLLIPSIEGAAADYGEWNFLPAVLGFIAGGLFLVVLDKVVPHFHAGISQEEGPASALNKPIKMFLAMTIHNIPEGLAVGFAFGAAASFGTQAAAFSALGLAVGIAVQNFPEGAAVALPLQRTTKSRKKAFLFGTASGAVEPVAAVIGYYLAAVLIKAQPWLLSFAAGAMIFVVAEDLIPEAESKGGGSVGTWGVIAGFAIMTALDVALG